MTLVIIVRVGVVGSAVNEEIDVVFDVTSNEVITSPEVRALRSTLGDGRRSACNFILVQRPVPLQRRFHVKHSAVLTKGMKPLE